MYHWPNETELFHVCIVTIILQNKKHGLHNY